MNIFIFYSHVQFEHVNIFCARSFLLFIRQTEARLSKLCHDEF